MGLTVELMDGENSFIPISWISAILKSLNSIVGDEQVTVKSIVGT